MGEKTGFPASNGETGGWVARGRTSFRKVYLNFSGKSEKKTD